jgi:uncharacterized protein with HEPN domain
MPMRRDELYLADIVEACMDVTAFLDGVSVDEWISNREKHYAVLARLTVIGEAARQLPAAVRDRHPHIPWRLLGDFRNLAVHDYFAVEWPFVWAVARNDVPTLLAQMRALLAADYPLVLIALDEHWARRD